MLFTLFWGPGNFYPLMIFVVIHMVIAALLHIVFSEDLAFFKKGFYLKFFHNVIMNSFASIYFHNYLRFDEMPASNQKDPEFIDSQKPGLHVSTFLRQLMFDFLYAVEYVVLLTFAVSTHVPNLGSIWTWIVSIVIMALISVLLRLIYYLGLHIWSSTILSDKKLIKREFEESTEVTENLLTEQTGRIQKKFFKYTFVQRNTWILGKMKNIHLTLIVLPKEFVGSIGQRFQDIQESFLETKTFLSSKNCGFYTVILSLITFLGILFVILANVVMIAMLLVGIILVIPVSIWLFWYNLKSGFQDQDVENQLDQPDGSFNTQESIEELPLEIMGTSLISIFQNYPEHTMVSIEENLHKNGTISLKGKTLITPEEFDTFKTSLRSLNKKFKLKLLDLDHCDLTDEKLEKLIPLLVKFEKVTLNGSQKISNQGWHNFGTAIKQEIGTSSGCKLKKLELKIAAKDDEARMKLRREILLEELKSSTLTAHDALQNIASFLPYLEEVHLDDIFNDNKLLDLQKFDVFNKSPNHVLNAWQVVANSIKDCPALKLQTLSLSGCAINDEVMEYLAPALVRIKKVCLGHNPINGQGWQHLEKALSGNHALTHLSVQSLQTPDKMKIGYDAKYLHCQDMDQFAQVCGHLEDVDLSGQVEIGHEGWEIFFGKLDENPDFKLKNLKLKNCRVDSEAFKSLISAHPGLKLDHDDSASTSKQKCFCF